MRNYIIDLVGIWLFVTATLATFFFPLFGSVSRRRVIMIILLLACITAVAELLVVMH